MKTLATCLAIAFTLAFSFTLSGCNTVRGAGEDIQKAGSAIEGAAKRNTPSSGSSGGY